MLFKSQRSQVRYPHQPRVPDRLDLLCKHPAHPLPCRMRFIGAATSPKGQWYATYACPLCNSRQGWVFDRYTHRPFRLWAKEFGQ